MCLKKIVGNDEIDKFVLKIFSGVYSLISIVLIECMTNQTPILQRTINVKVTLYWYMTPWLFIFE